MFERGNNRICFRLAWREVRFHKARSLLTILTAVLVSGLFSFVLFLSISMKKGYEWDMRLFSNTQADILFSGVTRQEALRLGEQQNVKQAVWYQSIGTVQADGQEYELSAFGKEYADTVGAVPDRGRLPQAENEIAMDLETAIALGGTTRLGDAVGITWTTGEGETVIQEFTLVGTWGRNMQTNLLWVSDSLAQRYTPQEDEANVTVGIILWRNGQIRRRAEEIASAAGLSAEAEYVTNMVFEDYQVRFINHYIVPVLKTLPVIFLCGILMFFAVFQMSLELDIRFYGRMKTIGMTPFQMRRVVYGWAGILSAASIPLGWLAGFCINEWIFPTVMEGDKTTVYTLSAFLMSAALTWLAVFLACMYPAWRVSHMRPVQAVHYREIGGGKHRGRKRRNRKYRSMKRRNRKYRNMKHRSRKHRCMKRRNRKQEALCRSLGKEGGSGPDVGGCSDQYPGIAGKHKPVTLLRLAVRGMLRQKGRMFFSLASLVISAMFACGVAVQYTSFDTDMIVKAVCSFDYLVIGQLQSFSYAYQPQDESLSPQLAGQLREKFGEDSVSSVYYRETELELKDELLQAILDYYDQEHLDYFRDNYLYVGFEEGYEKIVKQHRITAVIYGVDDAMMRAVTEPLFVFTGEYDRRKFETGGWTYVSGPHVNQNYPLTDYQPMPEEGSAVYLEGREFAVMGTASKPPNSVLMKPDTPVYLEFYIPSETFLEMFPDSNLVQLCVTLPQVENKKDKQVLNREFREVLDSYDQKTGYSLYTVDKSQYEDAADYTLWYLVGPKFILSAVLLAVALLGFINLLLHRTLARSREFAVYRSLGMSRRELAGLVIRESVLYTVMAGLVLYPASFVSAGPLMLLYYQDPMEWSYTYQFTLLPTHILMLVLIVLAVLLPVLCVRYTEKEAITERLNMDE